MTKLNSKLQELKDQSTMDILGVKILDEGKFAELIVKECTGIHDKIDNGNEHLGTNNYCKAIAKHFGL